MDAATVISDERPMVRGMLSGDKETRDVKNR